MLNANGFKQIDNQIKSDGRKKQCTASQRCAMATPYSRLYSLLI